MALIRGEKMQELMEGVTVAFLKYQPRYKEFQQQVYDRYFR